jgi:predicted dehydrogenase
MSVIRAAEMANMCWWKPFTGMEEAQAIVDLAAQTSCYAAVNQNTAGSAAFCMRRLIPDGKIGAPTYASSTTVAR